MRHAVQAAFAKSTPRAKSVSVPSEERKYVPSRRLMPASARARTLGSGEEKAKSKAMHNAARGIKSATVGRFCE